MNTNTNTKTKPMKPHQEMDPIEGCPVGLDPRSLQPSELEAMGVAPTPVLKAIRAKCKDCAGNNEVEVRRCGMVDCALWPFRMGTNPFRAPPSEAQRAAAKVAGERLRRGREKVA